MLGKLHKSHEAILILLSIDEFLHYALSSTCSLVWWFLNRVRYCCLLMLHENYVCCIQLTCSWFVMLPINSTTLSLCIMQCAKTGKNSKHSRLLPATVLASSYQKLLFVVYALSRFHALPVYIIRYYHTAKISTSIYMYYCTTH